MGKNVQVTASTGIAAQNMQSKLKHFGTSTVHKFFALKDGRYENDELVDLIMSDENFSDTKENIISVDTIIIDEISMLSLKLLEQIHYVMKSVRKNSYPFGGVQIILSGDFYQLPPVPNLRFGDDGMMCYLSDLVKNYFHHVQLGKIHRQEELDLINALHQIACAKVNDDSFALLYRLKRTLPLWPDPVQLFAQNFYVELWNSDCLMTIEGDVKLYHAEDSGNKNQLSSLQAQKHLALKKMLIVNLSDEMVYGLTGKVIELHEHTVDFYFPTINKQFTLSRFPFTVFYKEKQTDIACRRRIPLRLCFALTVHKAQGLSLNHLSVKCKSMNQNGQLCSTQSGDMQAGFTNFSRSLLKKPNDSLIDFYLLPQKYPQQSHSCCNLDTTADLSTSCESEYEILFNPDFEPEEAVIYEDIKLIEYVNFIESYNEENSSYPLPDSVQIEQILEKVKAIYLHTDQQRIKITVIEKMKASECTNVFFFRYFWNAFMTLLDRFFVEEKAVTNKTASDFYKEVNQVLLSEKTTAITNIFEGEPVARKNVTFKVIGEIREKVLETAAEAIKKKAHNKLDTGEVFAESRWREEIAIHRWLVCTINYKREEKKSYKGPIQAQKEKRMFKTQTPA